MSDTINPKNQPSVKAGQLQYLVFDETVNLSGGRMVELQGDNFGTKHKIRTKWDTLSVGDAWVIEIMGERTLHFNGDRGIISKIRKHRKVKFELPWYTLEGTRKIVFEFNLKGASAKIEEARKGCGK